MDFFETTEKRCSCRAFAGRGIEEEKLQKILACANSAPSAGNIRAFEIFVIRDNAKKKALAKAALGQGFIAAATIVLVFCSNPERSSRIYGKRGEELYSVQDATISASYAQLAAVALGLASCWVGAFNEKQVLKAIGCWESLRPVCILPLGYAAQDSPASGRRGLDDIVHEC